MSILAVTPTRNRQQAISLLARWMRQQTMKPDDWLVIDDGDEPVRFEPPMTILMRRSRGTAEPKHSLCLNLRAGLPYFLADKILIMEDDEYYAPTYVEEMSRRLDSALAAGIGHSKYYHLALKRFYVHENRAHASLAQTAFRQELAGAFIRALADREERFVDIKFWKQVRQHGTIWIDGDRYDGAAGAQYVGIKGFPGTPGIGFGHQAMPQYQADDDLAVLRRWIRPEDFAEYERVGREQLWMSRKG